MLEHDADEARNGVAMENIDAGGATLCLFSVAFTLMYEPNIMHSENKKYVR